MAVSPELTDAYFGRLFKLAEAIEVYRKASQEDAEEALRNVGIKLAMFESQIVLDLTAKQLREEIERYGEEAFYAGNRADIDAIRAAQAKAEAEVRGDTEEGDGEEVRRPKG